MMTGVLGKVGCWETEVFKRKLSSLVFLTTPLPQNALQYL